MTMIYISMEFWWGDSENWKTKIFGPGRSMGQNDHSFRLNISEKKNSLILYELPLWLCFMK